MEQSADQHMELVYFIGTFGMLLLAGAIFFFFITYQKRLLKKEVELNRVKAVRQEEILRNTVMAQEKERQRIARDLHDEVGAMLSVIKLNVARIEKSTMQVKEKVLAAETKTYVDETITQVRRISRALLPPSLERLGLYFALEELANWVNKSDQLSIICTKTGSQFRFESSSELAIFRVVQEILNNAIKHAEAAAIWLNVRFSDDKVMVLVKDNGIGFNLDEKLSTGLGLKNLESRTKVAGAVLKMKSIPGSGTKALLVLNTRNDKV